MRPSSARHGRGFSGAALRTAFGIWPGMAAGRLRREERERCGTSKATSPQKVQRLAEFHLRFAGEADNEVGRDGAAGKSPQQPDAFEIPLAGIVPAVHPLQDGIRAGLQTQVELWAEIGVDAERLAEVLVDGARLQRARRIRTAGAAAQTPPAAAAGAPLPPQPQEEISCR